MVAWIPDLNICPGHVRSYHSHKGFRQAGELDDITCYEMPSQSVIVYQRETVPGI